MPRRPTPLYAGFGLLLLTLCLALPSASLVNASEIEIEAAGPDGPLKGTWVPAPAPQGDTVLIIPGSGPIDRDGNGGPGLQTDTYRLIAGALETHGIGSVRIDKRGLFGSAQATSNPDDVTLARYADDISAWIRVIRGRANLSCVWLLGHSEGGLIAITYAVRAPDTVCGVVLAATPGRPLADLIREQFRANPANAPILKDAERIVEDLERGRVPALDRSHPALQRLFRKSVQGFWRDLFAFRATKMLERFNGPVLVIQGNLDLQVRIKDAQRLTAAAPSARLIVLNGANHILKAVAGAGRTENLASYADPSVPLHPYLVPAIVDFIRTGGRP